MGYPIFQNKYEEQAQETQRKPYKKPRIMLTIPLETRAGSPNNGSPIFNPFDPGNLILDSDQ